MIETRAVAARIDPVSPSAEKHLATCNARQQLDELIAIVKSSRPECCCVTNAASNTAIGGASPNSGAPTGVRLERLAAPLY